jgi:hypothetical protein
MTFGPEGFGEGQHRYFRNVCRELRKMIESSQDVNKLDEAYEEFLNAGREIDWPHKNSEIYAKDEFEKIFQKLNSEYQRYKQSLQSGNALGTKDLLDALSIAETLGDRIKAR